MITITLGRFWLYALPFVVLPVVVWWCRWWGDAIGWCIDRAFPFKFTCGNCGKVKTEGHKLSGGMWHCSDCCPHYGTGAALHE